jgi:hypothetical protein
MNRSDVSVEVSKVSIASSGEVRIAFPASMTELELGLVLHGMAGVLISKSTGSAPAGNGRAENPDSRFEGLEVVERPKAQSPQGKDRKTLGDRRGLPRKKVTKRSRNGKKETLSCGHVIDPVPSNWKRHKSRACEQCAAVVA